MIRIETPEACGTCFHLTQRQGQHVVCPNCGIIGTASEHYENTWEPEKKTNRFHVRGWKRGAHRGELAR